MAHTGEAYEKDEHQTGTRDQGLATAEVFNDIQASKGGSEVNSSQNDLSDETVGNTGTLEDGGTL